MSFLVATNVVASRPPERRPTGMPHTRAKNLWSVGEWWVVVVVIDTNFSDQRKARPNWTKSFSQSFLVKKKLWQQAGEELSQAQTI